MRPKVFPIAEIPFREATVDVSGYWQDGDLLVIEPIVGPLPFCVKTNEPAEFWWGQYFGFWKPVAIHFGLSRHWQRMRRVRMLLGGLLFLSGGGVIWAVIFLDEMNPLSPPARIVAGGLALAFAIGVWVGALACLYVIVPVRPARITATHLWFRGVHPDFLARLPKWPGESG